MIFSILWPLLTAKSSRIIPRRRRWPPGRRFRRGEYGIPYDLCGENPYQARGAAFTTAPGKSADEQYSVAGAVQMMIWILTDGMSQAEFNMSIAGDGAVTVTASLQMFG